MTKKHKVPNGFPAIATPPKKRANKSGGTTTHHPNPLPGGDGTVDPTQVGDGIVGVVEEEKYQLDQKTVEAVLATCPRCGSTERTPFKEIAPRIPTGRGLLIRYRTQCLGRINPVDRDGNPVVDTEGNPVSYECGNRYKVKAFVPNVRVKRGKAAS